MKIKLADLSPQTDLLDGFDAMQAIGISRARLMLRGRGQDPRPPSHECVRRWMTQGCPLRGGAVLKLAARWMNNQYLTMESWVREFEAERLRLSELDPLADEPTTRAREAAKKRASAELDRLGIGTPRK